MLRRLSRFITTIEGHRSFLEQWGLWMPLRTALAVVWSGAVIVASYMGGVPFWAWLLISGLAVAAALAAINAALGMAVKRKQMQAIDKVILIDREALATELEDMSRKVAGLVGEFRGPMQEAWWNSTKLDDPRTGQVSYARTEGQLIERYSHRHGADVWRLIRRASKVVPLDQEEIWRIQNGIRGEHDLVAVYMLLAALADDVRTPKAPLPRTDRRVDEQVAIRAGGDQPQLLTGIEEETQR